MLVVVGVVTATFELDQLADNRVAAGSAAIALVGLALLPWHWRAQRPSSHMDETPHH